MFKDISIKKGSLYAGQTQNLTSVNATLPADPDITIQQLVDFVKSDFAGSQLFSEKIPQKGNLRFLRTETDGQDLRFLLSEYSEEEHDLIVDVLKLFVGFNLNRTDEEYQEYLRKKGVAVSKGDAHAFAVTAMRSNITDYNQRNAAKRKAAGRSLWKTSPAARKGLAEQFRDCYIISIAEFMAFWLSMFISIDPSEPISRLFTVCSNMIKRGSFCSAIFSAIICSTFPAGSAILPA